MEWRLLAGLSTVGRAPRTYRDPDGEIPLTQEVLAEMAGTPRATLNQVLRSEQARGTLELRRGRTIVLDADEIARRAR